MPNTIGSRVYRDKYRMATLDTTLRNALVAEKVCQVDRSDAKRIQNPYGSKPTTVVQALAGTYSVANFTLTDDALEVNDEFIVAEHVYDFEETLTQFNLFASRVDEQNYSVATKIDQFVINCLTEDATGAYTTPAGGFSVTNTNAILANLASQVMGYADTYKGLFLIIETTDVPGIANAQMNSGFSYADMALNNGLLTSQQGIDIYVVRPGTFVDATVGTKTWTNSGHRVFGVKGVATYAAPRGIRFEEKPVSGKTGMEVVTFGYVGFKLWATKTDLVVDITLA